MKSTRHHIGRGQGKARMEYSRQFNDRGIHQSNTGATLWAKWAQFEKETATAILKKQEVPGNRVAVFCHYGKESVHH